MNADNTMQRVILQVRSGPDPLRKAILKPSQSLRVGASAEAGLALPPEAGLSRAHFELTWDGVTCRLKDLGSVTGTLLAGQRIKEGTVVNGDWVRAGMADFSVYFERTSPLPASQEHSATEALSELSQQDGLYAIFDSARGEQILPLLQESVEEYRSLYTGPQGEALSDVAPYLVRIPRGSGLLPALVHEGWGKSWGIYLTCPLSLMETRRHLRKFLMAEAEGIEGKLYFRFYDPRVLHGFLPTCSLEQRREFFGSISNFFYEEGNGSLQIISASAASTHTTGA